MRRKALFYVLLAAATVSLSQLLAAWRAWRAAATLEGGATVAAYALAVLAALLWLGFILYEVDRAAGRVRHRVALYEWVLTVRRPPERRTGTAGRGGGEWTWRDEAREAGQRHG